MYNTKCSPYSTLSGWSGGYDDDDNDEMVVVVVMTTTKMIDYGGVDDDDEVAVGNHTIKCIIKRTQPCF